MLASLKTFAGEVNGRRFVVTRGQTIDDDHPIVRKYPDAFSDAHPQIKPWDVESATAAPGEVRSLDLSHMEEEEETLDTAVTPAVSEDLSLEELRTIAASEGLATYGAKPALVERINKKRGLDG